MDLYLHDPGKFLHMLEGRLQLGATFGFDIAGNEILDARHHGAQFTEMLKGLMGAFGKVSLILPVEQTLDEAFQLLPANLREYAEVFCGRFEIQARQPKWGRPAVMLGQAVPEAIYQNVDEFVQVID